MLHAGHDSRKEEPIEIDCQEQTIAQYQRGVPYAEIAAEDSRRFGAGMKEIIPPFLQKEHRSYYGKINAEDLSDESCNLQICRTMDIAVRNG
jgi:hypothetical protein